MDPVYVIHGFPERRPSIEYELIKHGKVHPAQVHWVESSAPPLHACRRWRDPYGERLLTQGELACAWGHLRAWRAIAGGKADAAIVLEDDARILKPLKGFSWDFGASVPNLVYLGGKCLDEPGPLGSHGLREAPYTYWCIGYWLNHSAAKELVDGFNEGSVIPADEYIPFRFGKNPNVDGPKMEQAGDSSLNAWVLPEWIVEPSRRFQSKTENSPSAFQLKTYLPATDPGRAGEMQAAYHKQGYSIDLLGAGEASWDTSGPGGIQKLHWFKKALGSLKAGTAKRTVVLLADGYDTLPVVGPDNLLQRFAEAGSDLVIGGEMTCWPDPEIAPKFGRVPGPYRYPCSGTVMGFAEDLLGELNGLDGETDDQAYLQRCVLNHPTAWKVDNEAYLFQAINGAEPHLRKARGGVLNRETRCYPAIFHANGPASLDLVRDCLWERSALSKEAGNWMEVADGILAMPFLDPEYCKALVERSHKETGLWQPLPGDNVPGDELRLRAWDQKLNDRVTHALNGLLSPIIETRWRPCAWHEPKDLFLIRYSKDRQPSLRLHEDKSYFSCSIQLQRGRCGGEMVFPRQNFSDALVSTGSLLCWPSRITHPHQIRPVQKGQRVSLVVWTQA